jgi:sugar lactone lactonase YvrE
VLIFIGFILVGTQVQAHTDYINESYRFVYSLGHNFPPNVNFLKPLKIAISNSNIIFVMDSNNNRVQKFNPSGGLTYKWMLSDCINQKQVVKPNKISIDLYNNIYILNFCTSLIEKRSSNGTFIENWKINPSIIPEKLKPLDMKIDSVGNLYILQSSNHSLQLDTPEESFIIPTITKSFKNFNNESSSSIALDNKDNVYIYDSNFYSIKKFSFTPNDTLKFITKWGSKGKGDGQFIGPVDLTVDQQNNIYVLDSGNYRVQKFDSNGNLLTKWGSKGNNNGQFIDPQGIAADSANNVYITDKNKNNIQVFAKVS